MNLHGGQYREGSPPLNFIKEGWYLLTEPRTSLNTQCAYCACREGELHLPIGFDPCDYEICPFCYERLVRCRCVYEQLSIPYGPDTAAYKRDFGGCTKYFRNLTEAQRNKWERLLERKGRIPWIDYPTLIFRCARCGALGHDDFPVSREDWEKYVDPDHWDKNLCWACFDEICALIDGKGDKYIRKPRPRPNKCRDLLLTCKTGDAKGQDDERC